MAVTYRPQPDHNETDPRVLHDHIEELNEELSFCYLRLARVPFVAHDSDCQANNGPTLRPGPCNCGAAHGLVTGNVRAIHS
jgi:hypothetical protein